MGAKRGKFFSVVLVLVMSTATAHSSRAVMNPLQPIDMQDQDEDLPSTDLKAEARAPFSKSEVMELLAEDELRSQGNSSQKPGQPSSEGPRMDCSKITMQIFQVLLQNPDTVEPEDYSCGLLNLISHFEKSNGKIRSLEASLHTATTTIKTLETSLQTEISKTQFLMKELNETVQRESERAIKAENVIARRVLSEKSRVDTIQKNLTDVLGTSMDQLKDFETVLKRLESTPVAATPPEKDATTPYQPVLPLLPPQLPVTPAPVVKENEIQKIEVKLSSLQQFIQDLSNRISQMEDGSEEHVNKGIAQIFKTYATLANDIEKESERAKEEESNLKTLITNEVVAIGKQIATLQDRITEEKNRVQVIENRRTADLFEEINRAKSEEARLGQKLKEEMSKAAAAFKRLEMHVDGQFNSTKGFDDELKIFAMNATKRMVETEEKLLEQLTLERTRAMSAENTLKVNVDGEIQRALMAENELRVLITEEKERTLTMEQELKSAVEVEVHRAKAEETSISVQIAEEIQRAKAEETQLSDHLSTNMTRLLADVIKEFTRAQNAEMELSQKLGYEMDRATGAEQKLYESIVAEKTRATEQEMELYLLMKEQENSTKVVDKVKDMIQEETQRARNAETGLETLILDETTRAKDNQEKMLQSFTQELDKFKNLESNVTQTSTEIMKYTRDLELEVRKTVMAEVARAVDAENSLKQQIAAESERARGAETALSFSQANNTTDIALRMQDMMREVEKDSLRLEDISLQISRNLTQDILTLAELFDDKLDDLERSENVRLKKIEDDMKKCCSSSSWRWRNSKGKSVTGSVAGTVMNKIMQAFGGSEEEDPEGSTKTAGSKKPAGKSGLSKKDGSKGRSFSDSLDYDEEETEAQEPTKIIPILNSTQPFKNTSYKSPSNETVIYVHSQKVVEKEREAEEKKEKSILKRLQQIQRGRKAMNMRNDSSKDSFISIYSANSKVTSRFG